MLFSLLVTIRTLQVAARQYFSQAEAVGTVTTGMALAMACSTDYNYYKVFPQV